MNNTLNFNSLSSKEAYLRDKVDSDATVLKTKQFHGEIRADGATTSMGTLRRYTKQKTSALFGFLGTTSDLVYIWAANEASNVFDATKDFIKGGINYFLGSPLNADKLSTSDNNIYLHRSLSDRFALADAPEFVSHEIADILELQRDVALREFQLIASGKFQGPLRPETQAIVDAANSYNPFERIWSESTFQREILAIRGLIELPSAQFGYAVSADRLNQLQNSFSYSTGLTPIYVFRPIGEITTARAFDARPTSTPAFNLAN